MKFVYSIKGLIVENNEITMKVIVSCRIRLFEFTDL